LGSGWRLRWVLLRNRVLSSPAFQRGVARLPLARGVARRRARQLFDLLAGFTYTQTLLATVESGLLAMLARQPADNETIARDLDLSPDAADRLLRAAASLDILEEVAPGLWALGQQGAALHGNPGAQAMIEHHRLLYADLADPLALLRQDRREPTSLSQFWRYAANADAAQEAPDETTPYSELMAVSHGMVAEQVLAAVNLSRARSLLDVGGGHGAFAKAVADRYPSLGLGLFDLPGVIEGTRSRLRQAGLEERVTLHGGDFFRDSLPSGYDCISLIRILHDHDDAPTLALLSAIRAALPPGGRLVIGEPMAGTPGARAVGDAYFGFYLWAMRSGRARRRDEIGALLGQAGFRAWRMVPTRLPAIASVIVAYA
jgi:demethylspheroidene O-methyltransferase